MTADEKMAFLNFIHDAFTQLYFSSVPISKVSEMQTHENSSKKLIYPWIKTSVLPIVNSNLLLKYKSASSFTKKLYDSFIQFFSENQNIILLIGESVHTQLIVNLKKVLLPGLLEKFIEQFNVILFNENGRNILSHLKNQTLIVDILLFQMKIAD